MVKREGDKKTPGFNIVLDMKELNFSYKMAPRVSHVDMFYPKEDRAGLKCRHYSFIYCLQFLCLLVEA